MLSEIEDRLRARSSQYLFLLELLLYIAVGVLLCIAAAGALFAAGAIIWQGVGRGLLSNYGLLALDQLLLVLMLVEILHTVRISVHSKELMLIEPFLIVGMIASIRLLVITCKLRV